MPLERLRRSHIERRAAGRLGQFAKRVGLRAASAERGAPPRALGLAYARGHFLLMKIVDRQGDNECTYEQRDHGRQPQGFGFWTHRDGLFFPRLRHKEFPNVAKIGHWFGNERMFATETHDCRQGTERANSSWGAVR